MKARLIPFLFFLVVLGLSACTLVDADRWAAYSVEVQVLDEKGSPLSGAEVRTTDNLVTNTGFRGIARLYYTSGGLHVITVSAQGKETVQAKISLPSATQGPVSVTLSPQTRPLSPLVDTE